MLMKTLRLLIVGVVACAALVAPPGDARQPERKGSIQIGVAEYTLGDRAFTYPGLYRDPERGSRSGLAPIELTGRVYYPKERGKHPLVIMIHGSWETCADRQAGLLYEQALALENAWDAAHPGDKSGPGLPNPDQNRLDAIIASSAKKLNRWPCASGTPALTSYAGFDYLGRVLAAHGITAVSISANGINAVGLGDVAVAARAALINKHLALWAQLDRTGRGPLAARLTAVGGEKRVDLRHSLDMSRVGVLGHSRGGKAVFWQAADAHSGEIPKGVRVRGVVSLAPQGAAEVEPGSPEVANYRVSKVPFLVWQGTCDFATGNGGRDYFTFNPRSDPTAHYLLTVNGADHNFLNEQWSPSSGQVVANDDVDTPGVPRPVPGQCTIDGNSRPELGETDERAASSVYLVAFFARELRGERRWQPVLDGKTKPLASRVVLDISRR